MKKLIAATAVLGLAPALASAGGLDRSGQGIGAIFNNPGHVEFSFGYVDPDVSGTSALCFGCSSGDVAPAYTQFGAATVMGVGNELSLGLIFDQPFGASVEYNTAPYPANGAVNAEVNTFGVTALVRKKLDDGFSVYGGPRLVNASGNVTNLLSGYGPLTYEADTAIGYVVGAAYEVPEIALRLAITYSSALSMTLPRAGGETLAAELPQSINLDVQSGIAEDTLLFGSVRWADWTESSLVDSDGAVGTLVDHDEDVLTYTLGLGRRFSDDFSGAVSLGYEAAQGNPVSDLSPTDGYFSIGIGGTKTMQNDSKLTMGIRYISIGDATTDSALAGDFSDNSGLAIGFKFETSM